MHVRNASGFGRGVAPIARVIRRYDLRMLTLDQFLDACAHETTVIQHLATKVPENALDYRPTDGQRSMLEFMQYMTRMAALPMARAVEGDWERNEEFAAESEAVTAETFADEMDRQMEILREEAAKLADRPFDSECSMPWGVTCTLGEFLVNAVLTTYKCYRMQFFLYCKSAGAHELGPAQCWIGLDPPG